MNSNVSDGMIRWDVGTGYNAFESDTRYQLCACRWRSNGGRAPWMAAMTTKKTSRTKQNGENYKNVSRAVKGRALAQNTLTSKSKWGENAYVNNGSGFPWILHGKWISLPRSTYMSITGFWFVVGAIFVDISIRRTRKRERGGGEEIGKMGLKWKSLMSV